MAATYIFLIKSQQQVRLIKSGGVEIQIESAMFLYSSLEFKKNEFFEYIWFSLEVHAFDFL